MRMTNLLAVAAMSLSLLSPGVSSAAVRITEFMSEGQGDTAQGNGGRRQREFFELTNLGSVAVDVSAWSYNDNNSNDPINWGPDIGSILPGESVVFTQMTVANFRSYWNLADSVRIFSFLQLSNLGNADTINIYNSSIQAAATLVDTLTYTADARGSGISRNRPFDGATGQYLNGAWVVSQVGDVFHSVLAPNAAGFPPNFPNAADYTDLANPGYYPRPVPLPAAAWLLASALGGLKLAGKRRRPTQD